MHVDTYKYWMRATEFTKRMQTFVVRIRLPQQGYTQHMDTTVQARTAEQARRIIRGQYGNRAVMVGQPRRITPR